MRIALDQGAYTARSVIANAQRAVNIYPELNPPDAPCKYTHYNAPGLVALGISPSAPGRGLYWANNDSLYYVAGNILYQVDINWNRIALGTLGSSINPVSFADNGSTLLVCDGSPTGYQVNLLNNAFSLVNPTTNGPPSGSGSVYAFYGADRIDMMDGYIVLNEPGTQNVYCTYNNEIVFDALFFASKNTYSDLLVAVVVARRQLWLIGQRTAEIWFDAGSTPGFPFEIIPGPFVQHGCSAKYSIAQVDGVIFWLSQDQAGNNIVARGDGSLAARISTHAIEQEWGNYPTTTDAQGFTFQLGGHSFYQINFPTADKSWRWDESTRLWHEVAWMDGNGASHRHRAACAANAYGLNVVADWQTGQLYSLDPDAYTDAGAPMYWRRGFPHLLNNGKRVIYPGLTIDIEAATDTPGDINPALVEMRYSDDRGRTWSNPLSQPLGQAGQYLTQPKFWRLGSARDRVFECYGTIPGRIAINGAFLDPEPIPMAS